MPTYYCFSQRLAGFLLSNGFAINGIKTDSKNTGRNVYLFTDCDSLRETIEKYKKV